MKNYEPRKCEFCGKEYIPRSKRQRTCGSAECQHKRQRMNWKDYQMRHYGEILEGNRRCMARKRAEQRAAEAAKRDTIIAIGYAERQMAKSLEMAGKVKVDL